jgi:HlyD family secretion protein
MSTATEQRRARQSGPPESGATRPDPLGAVEALERDLLLRQRGRWWKLGALVLLVVGGAYGAQTWREAQKPVPPPPFVTAKLELRDIVEAVESSGKLKPLTEVKVGTQISGRVVRVHADFNRPVKKGDLLAEIDPSLFGAQVSQVAGQLSAAEAQLERARAAQHAAQIAFERTQQLKSEAIASQAELDQAENSIQIARADVVAASAQIQGLAAQLKSANTTLAYTRIYSPIDGIVIDRAVDPGQTVAASFSAPILFVIAQDLSAMQVLADIDEADVGKITEGMTAQVRVDAFPDQTFAGLVTQIRYNPTEVQGVVTYAAVLDVKNDELKLRPGMTATVNITAKAVKGVNAVRNAALRFKPKDPAQAGAPVELEPGQRRLYVVEEGTAPALEAAAAPAEPRPETAAASPQQHVSPRLVRVGITDGVWTELLDGSLAVGAEVVTEERSSPEEKRRKFLGIF